MPPPRSRRNSETCEGSQTAGENAQIALSEVKRGLFPMGGTSVRLTRQIAYAHAMELMLTGEPVSGARAAEIGLVGHAVPDGTAAAAGSLILSGRCAREATPA